MVSKEIGCNEVIEEFNPTFEDDDCDEDDEFQSENLVGSVSELYNAELRRSPIWKYFIVHPESDTMACKICLCSYHSMKTSTAERHLKTKHSNVYDMFKTKKQRWMKLRVLHRHVTKNGLKK